MDDLIAEIHKSKSKMKHREKNPLPPGICIFGWCKPFPQKEPSAPKASAAQQPEPAQSGNVSSSKPPDVQCDEAMDRALRAAHDVDVGDTYFGEKNYRAALFRYQSAQEDKPDDAAILVRLGRAYEKLKQPSQAKAQYQAAAKLPGPAKWTDEAQKALQRFSSPQ